MPKLNLTFAVEISPDEEELLCNVLGVEAAQLEATVISYGPAALREYIDMFTGTGLITTAAEVRERRLVGLMVHHFQNDAPDPEQIARLFNTTPGSARSLLRAVASKYRLKVGTYFDAAIKATLKAAAQEAADKPYIVVIRNRLIVEHLNRELESAPVSKTPIKRQGDSINLFAIDEGSYDYLAGRYNVAVGG